MPRDVTAQALERQGLVLLAARLAYSGNLTDEQIAQRVQRSRKTVNTWKQSDIYKRETARLAEIARTQNANVLLRNRDYRLEKLQDRHDRLLTVIQERAKYPELAKVPGGKTGALVLEPRTVAGEKVVVAKFDAALFREIRDLERQAAEECGQYGEASEDAGRRGSVRLSEALIIYREIVRSKHGSD
ncbi:MAG TPA: hypothetical protein VMW15_04840 [Terracidiphilus sp.]|nr:hypothetical protein [Terracidiphilus sp.]